MISSHIATYGESIVKMQSPAKKQQSAVQEQLTTGDSQPHHATRKQTDLIAPQPAAIPSRNTLDALDHSGLLRIQDLRIAIMALLLAIL